MTPEECIEDIQRLIADWPHSPESSDRYFDIKRILDEYESGL